MLNRSVIEVVVGVFYAMGAAGQALWILPRGQKWYEDMADRAWLPPVALVGVLSIVISTMAFIDAPKAPRRLAETTA